MIDTNPIRNKKKEDIKPTEAGNSFLVNPNEATIPHETIPFPRIIFSYLLNEFRNSNFTVDVDVDGSGEVDFLEFCSFYTSILSHSTKAEQFEEA